ncbi:MAG: Sir2 family NAD-dependent protein deacetylase [Micrococcus sp.]|nr:Sir2 family NAD-dependent protein deacetylase [Micrococcus sp.]
MRPADPGPARHPALDGHQAALRSIARVVHETAPLQDAEEASAGLLELLRDHRPLVITGAGVSTDSGIPDYRGPGGSLHRHRPMTYQEFRHDPAARHRYWARSFIGWRRMDEAQPNTAHRILARWSAEGVVAGIITQNVDGLHAQAAAEIGTGGDAGDGVARAAGDGSAPGDGSDGVGPAPLITLHGDLSRVACLQCGAVEERPLLDARLEAANPGYLERVSIDPAAVNPDGDVTLDQHWVDEFVMVGCRECGSVELKPDVVYFGENIPAGRREQAEALLEDAGSVLAVGSSLAVMSGYRFVLRAERSGRPVGLINLGPTRADAKAQWRWRAPVADALTWLDARL